MHLAVMWNLLMALLLGVLIGIERQWRQRAAGLRTNACASRIGGDCGSPQSGVGCLGGQLGNQTGDRVKHIEQAQGWTALLGYDNTTKLQHLLEIIHDLLAFWQTAKGLEVDGFAPRVPVGIGYEAFEEPAEILIIKSAAAGQNGEPKRGS